MTVPPFLRFALVGALICSTQVSSQFPTAAGPVCNNDLQCMRRMDGYGACCVFSSLLSRAAPQCKTAGDSGDLCHVGSNFEPYPFWRPHGFGSCPCGRGLTCVPLDRSFIGVCK
ncbi:Hypp1496 [Branchiostoma lanceolatum]|uniref:Hypp1496 protein n=1 Tax=Branchiostoma lanceolatum TaxID=7740 RepID=A0A8K0EJ49_BRALA|nr:Hypp1496 [Branchiostoma lanceolatum]